MKKFQVRPQSGDVIDVDAEEFEIRTAQNETTVVVSAHFYTLTEREVVGGAPVYDRTQVAYVYWPVSVTDITDETEIMAEDDYLAEVRAKIDDAFAMCGGLVLSGDEAARIVHDALDRV